MMRETFCNCLLAAKSSDRYGETFSKTVVCHLGELLTRFLPHEAYFIYNNYL